MTFPSDSTENVTYTYDQTGHGSGIGRLTSVSDAAGTLSRSYDQLGNLLTDARTTGTINLTTTYSYDLANRVASITYPSGTQVSYTRDTMGRVTAVTEKPSGGTSATVVTSVGYEPFGPDTGFRNATNQETRGFDQDYRLTNVTDLGTVRRGVTRVLQNLSYAYYPTNYVETITDAVTSGNDQSFSYDSLQRLSTATGSYGSYGFTYDNDGNRLTQALGGVTTNYGYGTGNDLLTTISVGGVTTQTIGYTADGKMASLNPGIQAPGGQYITSLSYNQAAQLAAVNAGSSALASYTYDGFGQRLLKTFSSTSGNIYQYGQNGMLLEETNQAGAAQADYIYLNGRPIADLAPSSGTVYYLQDDMLGTPQQASDSSQNIAWQASYGPFGQTPSVTGTITQNLRLPGQYFDSESGWNHKGFRNYIPDLGRYAEPDPLALQGNGVYYDASMGHLVRHSTILSAANVYSYVGSNPINVIDQLGLSPCKRLYCAGTAYALAGNSRNIGKVGFPGVTVTNGSAAVVPREWTGQLAGGPLMRSIGASASGIIFGPNGQVEEFSGITQSVGEASLGTAQQAQDIIMARAPGALILEVVGGQDLGKNAGVLLDLPDLGQGCPAGTTPAKVF